MVQRVTVTIPEELGERLDAVKGSFNVSRVCQEALASAVLVQELSMKGNKSMEDIIERLKAEKQQSDRAYLDAGRTQGAKDARELEYNDLKKVSCLFEGWDEQQASGYSDQIVELNCWTEWLEDEVQVGAERDAAFDRELYLKGWVEEVRKFWDEVKDKL